MPETLPSVYNMYHFIKSSQKLSDIGTITSIRAEKTHAQRCLKKPAEGHWYLDLEPSPYDSGACVLNDPPLLP